ncbi:MAG: sigma-54-dependent Fis family transcriptional regulator [SAR86 cluster bacterium]|uniref:Sigma-54-dependent Fis family transcriptional regulator n=1 Tax=SAR86 cluster bacterium TaxID=2030880 RepID=A0A2A5B7B3_9GAMM|nr:MAG: sigma-54-dependent Fis family transcriptional regulator [SAR86 cluster bacterium]
MKEHLLIADDDPDVVSALRYLLLTEGFDVTTAGSPQELLEATNTQRFSAILMDLNYSKDTTSGQEGLQLIQQLHDRDASLPIVAMTAWGSIDTAVKAMQAGARDFVQKPWENARLLSILANQIRLAKAEQKTCKLSEENKILRNELTPVGDDVFCRSAAMREAMAKIEQVARSDASMLLTGENGTGKSFLVNRIHELSERREHPLIKVNMGTITDTLFESEMFGHLKGSFTDAHETRIGRIELADGGTLFLDEIGNTPYSQQAKLLRVLEDYHYEKVGSSQTQVSDCRLICATNTNLEAAVSDGSFRKDLLYRINTVVIEVPPLRNRKEDILPFAELLLESLKRKYNKPNLIFSAATRQALQSYCWPGNVRELVHVVERSAILAQDIIEPQVTGVAESPDSQNDGVDSARKELTLEQIEKQAIQNRIHQHQGDSFRVADSLGLSKSAFYRHLKKHGLK